MELLPLTKTQQRLFDYLCIQLARQGYPPSQRQMMEDLGLKTLSSITWGLRNLKEKGYITSVARQPRTTRLTAAAQALVDGQQKSKRKKPAGLRIAGHIAAGELTPFFNDEVEREDIPGFLNDPDFYGLRVRGDSMIGAHIKTGDLVVMRPAPRLRDVRDGTIVAARVPDQGSTLKYLHRQGDRIILTPANPDYPPIEAPAAEVQLDGVYVALWRIN